MEKAQRLPETILIGGNHLANQLILLGRGKMPDIKDNYRDLLEKYGETYADIWVCWKAIMKAR